MSISILAAGPIPLPRTMTNRSATAESFGFAGIGEPVGQTIPVIAPKMASGASRIGNGSSESETSLNALMNRANTTLANDVKASGPIAAPASFSSAFSSSDANGDGVLSKNEFQNFDKAIHPGGPHLWEAATGKPVDGAYMFPLIDRAGHGYVTRDQAAQYDQVSPDGTSLSDDLGRSTD